MKTAVIYARYSSDNQNEQSIEGQLRVCQDYAQRNDILILNTYIDRAMTGTNDNRPDFQKMIKDSSNKEFEYIIVYKIDRFSRNKYETAKYKKILKDNGVKMLSAMENIPDSPEGIILESLLEGMAEYYSAELSQKVKRGMNETRLKGNFTGGQIIYGYKVENRKVIIDEEKAEIVRYIYSQYARGEFVTDIIAELKAKRIYNKGKPFARNTVYKILKNEKYAGIYRHNDEIFTNMYPAIVSAEIYNIVRKKIDQNKYGKRSTEIVYLLKHKLKCGYCGMPISAECGTASNGQKKHYYKCLGRKRHNGCEKQNIRKDLLESLVVDSIISKLSKPKILDTIIANLLKIQDEQIKESSILTSLYKEKTKNETMLNNVMSAIEQGIINTTTNKRMRELESAIDELEKQILIEKSKTRIKLSREDIQEFYKEALKLESKLLINYIVKEIIVYDDKIQIQFNTPLRTSPTDTTCSFFTEHKKIPCKYLNDFTFRTQDIEIILAI